ncbi:hypothetical protein FOA43_000889 [Brettanomyces nanus]|uniref:C2H2-type domain-containing protein n=1 Tax=Eeniella nana TaxID=13502 RepID=A0A875RTK0_EENNA|nr:uncharacterized protein FOA43_000889 [Brettanomyces nanus]QPG73577.1 hypothetical protein FOA43_000889 [Brettanomyces nanus]
MNPQSQGEADTQARARMQAEAQIRTQLLAQSNTQTRAQEQISAHFQSPQIQVMPNSMIFLPVGPISGPMDPRMQVRMQVEQRERMLAEESLRPQKRKRKKFHEVERLYKCNYPNCTKAYGTLNHLNCHIVLQKHGKKRMPSEFKELREKLKRRRKAEREKLRKQKEEEQNIRDEEQRKYKLQRLPKLPPIQPMPAPPSETSSLRRVYPPFTSNLTPSAPSAHSVTSTTSGPSISSVMNAPPNSATDAPVSSPYHQSRAFPASGPLGVFPLGQRSSLLPLQHGYAPLPDSRLPGLQYYYLYNQQTRPYAGALDNSQLPPPHRPLSSLPKFQIPPAIENRPPNHNSPRE